jgi:glyoxylase-like metal-dependent hydrolase (beta-lactamase superfamily II)
MQSEHVLLRSLQAASVSPDEVDVVVLSHLHFDHAGGLLSAWQDGAPYELLFPKAKYVVGARAWARAIAPHPRDRASFIPELLELLEKSGRLELVEEHSEVLPKDRYGFSFSDGHTPGLTMARVVTPRGPVTFVGDLIPGTPWVHLPITMGYDRYPELLIDEKRALLDRVIEERGWVFFTHDPTTAASRIERTSKGRYQPVEAASELSWSEPA